jgi:hypothetical protein
MTGSNPQPATRLYRALRTLLKTAASLLLLPLLLALSLISFTLVFADFLCFRLQDLRQGHPQPKGLWEF